MSMRPENILTPERVQAALSAHLPECASGALEIIDSRLADLTISPDVRAAAHFRLRFREVAGGREFSEGFTVRLPVPGGEPIDVPGDMAARYAAMADRRFASPQVALPDLGAVAQPYPLDTGLPGLLDALDARVMKDHFKRILAPMALKVMHVKIRHISYTLGARATLRYELRLRDADTAALSRIVIGKLNSRKEVATLMADNLALWRKTQGTFGQAQPLGVIQTLGLSLQTFVPGNRLTDHMEDADIAGHLAAVGTALGRFHAARIPMAKTRDASREQRSLGRRCDLLRDVVPEPARITSLEARVAAAFAQRLRLTGPTHGDFHHANVMVTDEGSVSLIDFDEMGLGDQALDVGRFIVSLSVPSLRVRGDLSLCDLARERFLAAYRAERPVSDAELGMFEAAGWVTSAVTAYRLQRPGWAEVVDQMITRAEAAIARTEAADTAEGTSTDPALDAAEISRWLQDMEYVSLLLKPHVLRAHGAELTGLALRDHRPVEGAWRFSYRATGKGADGSWRGRYLALAAPGANPRRIKRAVHLIRDVASEQDPGGVIRLPAISMRAQPLGAIVFKAPGGTSLNKIPLEALEALAPALADAALGLAALDCAPVRTRSARDLAPGAEPALLAQIEAACPEPVAGFERCKLSALYEEKGEFTCARPDQLVWGPAPLLHAGLAQQLAERCATAAALFAERLVARSGIDPQIWNAAMAAMAKPSAAAAQ